MEKMPSSLKRMAIIRLPWLRRGPTRQRRFSPFLPILREDLNPSLFQYQELPLYGSTWKYLFPPFNRRYLRRRPSRELRRRVEPSLKRFFHLPRTFMSPGVASYPKRKKDLRRYTQIYGSFFQSRTML